MSWWKGVPEDPKKNPLCCHDSGIEYVAICTACEAFNKALERIRVGDVQGTLDALHPNGYCTCHGEGRCHWCKNAKIVQ